MSRSIPAAGYNPTMLEYSRRVLSMSSAVAAKKLNVSEEDLAKLESGEIKATVAKLRLASSVYKTPLPAFWLPVAPRDMATLPDRRSLPGASGRYSTNLLLAVRDATARHDMMVELADDLGDEPVVLDLSARLSEAPAAVAARVRAGLGITAEDQLKANGDYGSLSLWRTAIEDLGLLVFGFSRVPVEEARGFAIHYDRFPVIGVNNGDGPTARVFSLLHELVHVLLRQSSVCDMDARHVGERVEVFCNAVAGHTLVPEALLHELVADVETRPDGSWAEGALHSIARRLGVSAHVVARRLTDSGLMSDSDYRHFYGVWSVRKHGRSGGGGTHYRNVVARLGRPFISTVLRAHANERISTASASQLLGTQAPKLGKLEAALGGA